MISAWHLAWIIPISVMFGVFLMMLMVAAGNDRRDDE